MNFRVLFVGIVSAIMLGFMVVPQGSAKKPTTGSKSRIERGKYLVTIGSCNDCHTPKKMTPMGPVLDTTKTLSGQRAGWKPPQMAATDLSPDKWMTMTNAELTAWYGPWGISYAKNLTPDKNTGLGSWTEAMFIKALRTGKDMGEGRQILPPMPWEFIGKMTDEDLKSVFAYLQSLPPVSNAVPDPVPPPNPPGGQK